MKGQYVRLGLLALLFICLFQNLQAVQAEVVWSEDFNDGDFDGWTIGLGEWSVTNGTLQGQAHDPIQKYCTLSKSSTTAYGTWSFDVKFQSYKNLYISFIDNNGTFSSYGYYYELTIVPLPTSTQFTLYRQEGSHEDAYEPLIRQDIFGIVDGAWHHVEISRESNGRFSIYLDTELLFEVADNNISSSEVFVITSHQFGALLDNITVKNVVEPPTRVWQDSFDNGNFLGWGIQRGNWSAEKGFLRVSKDGDISRPSTTSVGTWSFDVYVTPVPERHFSFLFMSDTHVTYIPTDLLNFNGYLLYIYAFPDGSSSTLDLYSSTGSWIVKRELLDEYVVGRDLSYRWQHIDITREDEGRICVYLNSKLVIDIIDNSSNSSSFFQFLSQAGPAIDNIVVKDYVDPPQIQEWSDDFNDGDLDGWIIRGNWSAASNAAQAYYDPELGDDSNLYKDGRIKRPSDIAYGTWSLDIYLKHNKYILFSFFPSRDAQDLYYDYFFEIKPIKQRSFFYLHKHIGSEWIPLDQFDIIEDLTDRWSHIDITRDVQGRFQIFLDGKLILESLDNDYQESEYFRIYSDPYGSIIDNIAVKNVIDIFHPLPLDVSVEISEDEVLQGNDVFVSVQARDDYGFTIPRVVVDVSLEGETIDVNALGMGVYEAVVGTSELTGTVELSVTAGKAGFIPSESTHQITVTSPALFRTNDLSIEPSSVQIGETVEIFIEVSNVGGQEGSHLAVLKINDAFEDEQEVVLEPDGSETVIFEYTPIESGTYSVDVNGLTGSLTVEEPAPTPTPEPSPTPSPTPEPTPKPGGIPGFTTESIIIGLIIGVIILWISRR